MVGAVESAETLREINVEIGGEMVLEAKILEVGKLERWRLDKDIFICGYDM